MECQISDVTFAMLASEKETERRKNERKRSIYFSFVRSPCSLFARSLIRQVLLPFSFPHVARFLRHACAYGPRALYVCCMYVCMYNPMVLKPRALTLTLLKKKKKKKELVISKNHFVRPDVTGYLWPGNADCERREPEA